MARRKNPTNLLPPKAATALVKDGRHADGGGLYLQVKGNARSWLFVYRWDGRRVEMGLGRAGGDKDDVTLAAARNLALDFRRMLDEHPPRNPLEVRRAAEAAHAAANEIPTFGKFADEFIERRKSQFRNAKHLYQWEQTLGDAYCKRLRKKRIDTIETEDILSVLQPIWTTKQETASRLRGRVEQVLDAAKVKGHRGGENPARWKGHLEHLLSERKKLQRGHHSALPYQELPAFMAELREREAVSASALEFLILTASRSGEVRGAEWPEFDFKSNVWTVPGDRMKTGEPHQVPLTAAMIAVLDTVAPLSGKKGFVFPGVKKGRPLSDMVFKSLFKRMSRDGITAHGFRSSFRDWAGDKTSFPREVAEAALAHKVGDEVERAYRRSTALEKRRQLMQEWERYLSGETTKVVSIRITP
ncbi:tyrosine-type recombinase/integrase [Roseibium aggregatum]|uniref:tyrosine-type recombinase/integrase n=1 Tax=Roseibium aggregatum TaxID=187304 RepID=UPI001E2F6C82|nr:site-specific integrase [Roseibium aggregatum]